MTLLRVSEQNQIKRAPESEWVSWAGAIWELTKQPHTCFRHSARPKDHPSTPLKLFMTVDWSITDRLHFFSHPTPSHLTSSHTTPQHITAAICTWVVTTCSPVYSARPQRERKTDRREERKERRSKGRKKEEWRRIQSSCLRAIAIRSWLSRLLLGLYFFF